MDRLSHGFHVGRNNITWTKIIKWRNGRVLPGGLRSICDKAIELGFEISIDTAHSSWLKVVFNNDVDINNFYSLVISLPEE